MNISFPVLLTTTVLIIACSSNQKNNTDAVKSPNYLIFFVDDLRPELGCYGASYIHSPNINTLAREGLKFNRAYCNVPVCGASRASLLTGMRPTPQRFIDYDTRTDDDLPGHISLPAYFKENGYYTVSLGKIFHHIDDSQNSWSEPAWQPKTMFKGTWRDYVNPETAAGIQAGKISGPPTEIALNAPDSVYKDGKVAIRAIEKLRQFSKQEQPFMLWVGFLKPHLPFNAPSKYWDLYKREEIKLASNPTKPLNAPKEAMHNFGELRAYDGIPPTGPVSNETAAELIHGYFACVSYTDALIGQVMAELEQLDLDKNTIVAVFGDHGWNLGEHGLWCKHCNFNTSLHVPLIIKVPGKTRGQETEGLTEYVDLFPTFAELAGLKAPDWTEGKSLVPLFKHPDLEWKEPVYPRFIRGNSIVTENFIYSEYMRSRQDCTIVSNMLYDHRTDPDENTNVSAEDEYLNLVDSLSVMMNKVHLGK